MTTAVLVLAVAFAVALAGLFGYRSTVAHLQAAIVRAVYNAERLIDRTAADLAKLDGLRSAPCDAPTVRALQGTVYGSLSQIREIGLIRDQRLYCTNFGPTDREIPIPRRLLTPGLHIDVSPNQVVANNTSMMVYVSRETDTAVNALFNPEVLAEFERDYKFSGHGVLTLSVTGPPRRDRTEPTVTPVYRVGGMSADEAAGATLKREFASPRLPLRADAVVSARAVWEAAFALLPSLLALFGAVAAVVIVTVRRWLLSGNLDRLRYQAALQHDEFEVHYQPIVAVGTGEIVGLEALLRWHHPRRGLLRAAQFADLFAHEELAARVASRVLELVARDLERMGSDCDVWVSINLAPSLMEDNAALTEISKRVAAMGAKRVRLEITERSPIGEYAEVLLHELRSNEVCIGMDDIGTGYANLGQLQRMPFDFIKIDGMLVRGIRSLDGVSPVVHSLIQLARELHCDVIVEGVESEVQARALSEAGATHLQGFYFDAARPLPDLLPAIRERRALRPPAERA